MIKESEKQLIRNERIKIQFQFIKGTLEDIRECISNTFYADGIPYYSTVNYEIDILTDDMYTITVKPIAEGTIKDILKYVKKEKYYVI